MENKQTDRQLFRIHTFFITVCPPWDCTKFLTLLGGALSREFPPRSNIEAAGQSIREMPTNEVLHSRVVISRHGAAADLATGSLER